MPEGSAFTELFGDGRLRSEESTMLAEQLRTYSESSAKYF